MYINLGMQKVITIYIYRDLILIEDVIISEEENVIVFDYACTLIY